MKIASHTIGSTPFTVAEAGLNHNGAIIGAMEMIAQAKDAGCTGIKFQTFKADGVCSPDQVYTYKSMGKMVTEPRINIFKRAELPDWCWPALKAECERQGIIFMSTPQNPEDLDVLLDVGIPAIKIGSDDLTNMRMLSHVAATTLPVILSCGMSNLEEVREAIRTVGTFRGVAVLCCTSQYPCKADEANLRRIRTLKKAFPEIEVGFSDHTIGPLAATAAVALGATIFEKHMTLSHDLPGPDHWYAANPQELREWVDAINTAHTMLGTGNVEPSAKELAQKEKYQRRVA